jgi:DNA-binding transcriptional regulator YiaG
MRKGNITKYRLNPKRLPKADWRAFDAMSEEERHQSAVHDQDSPPATAAQLARARRVPAVRALRKKLKLTQQEFSARLSINKEEFIALEEADNTDSWLCLCGNRPNFAGFFRCDSEGNTMEPTRGNRDQNGGNPLRGSQFNRLSLDRPPDVLVTFGQI